MAKQQINEVFERLRTWPETRQQDAARVLIEMERQDSAPFQLSPEQVEDAKIGLAEADAGEFASDNQMSKAWSKFGL